MSFRYFDPHSFGRGFNINNVMDSYSSPGPGSYDPKLINKKSKNNDWMFRQKTFYKKRQTENKEPKNHNLKRQNIEPNDFYNVQEKYKNESKKPRILKYSFGKATRFEYKEKKKNNINIKTLRPKSSKIYRNFEEEKNNFGDNCPNNIIIKEEKNIKVDTSQNFKKAKKDNKEEDIEENDVPGVGKYNIRGSLKVPVTKFGTEKKGLNFEDNISPGPAKYNLREKEFGKTNIKYSIPKGPRGIKERPFTPGPGKYNPISNLIKKSSIKHSFPKDKRMHYFENTNPAPNKYNTTTKFGEDAKKITMSPYGRNPIKYNDFPGPNQYNPDYKLLKIKYPKYKIGTAKRKNLYEINPSFPAPNKYYINERYNSQKPKSSTWKIGTSKRPPLYLDKKTPGVGMYSLRNNRNNGPKYTLRGKFEIKNKEKRPGVGQYNIFKSSQFMMKKEPCWKIGKSSRDDKLTNDKRGIPGPGMYRIPCSIVDINHYTREQGKFDKNFIYV